MTNHRRAMLPNVTALKAANSAQRGRRYRRIAVKTAKWAKRGPSMLVVQRRRLLAQTQAAIEAVEAVMKESLTP